MFHLTNTGPGTRVVYDRNHQEVIIGPGETKQNVDMLEEHIDELHRNNDQLKSVDASLPIKEPAPTSQPELVEAPPTKPHTNRPPAQAPTEVSKGSAAALIEQADGMEFNAWKESAQKLLGNKWPGGSPRKAAIVELLRQEAK